MADSLNNGCKLAKGDWIARMDADDIMKENRIEKQIDFLKASIILFELATPQGFLCFTITEVGFFWKFDIHNNAAFASLILL